MRRHRLRSIALSVLVFFSFMLTTETAAANGATLPALSMPKLSLSALWAWANTSPLDTPDQASGTAEGKSHIASTAATSADGGSGRAAGEGQGQLDPYERPVAETEQVTTGPAAPTEGSFDPATSERDAAKSTATSDHFVNADGSTTVRHYTGRTNFQGPDGSWQPIDTSLVEGADGRYTQDANSLDVEFAAHANDAALASVSLGDGRALSYTLDGARQVTAVENADGTLVYPQVVPGTDVQLVPIADGFKENLVLNSPAAANSWLFRLDAEGLTPRLAETGDVEFTGVDGKVAATVPHAYMVDSKTDPRSGEGARSARVSYELTTVDGQSALRMTADRSWLDDPERVYPVTVDPTTVVSASEGTYVQSDAALNRSTETQIKVGSYDAGTNKANSFLQFSSLASKIAGQKVSAATLNVWALWASVCDPTPFSVYPVTQAWVPSTTTTYPGPTVGTAIGTASVNPGAACKNPDGSVDVGVKMPVTLSTSWFTQVATGGANYGLAMAAPTGDGLHWKRFHSDNSATAAWRPSLDLTYAANTQPQVNAQYPPENFQANTLQPELLVYASDADKWPNTALSYEFEVYDADSASTTPVVTSGSLAKSSWKIPAGKLKWSKNYAWYVGVSDGYDEVTYSSRFTTAVPQPPVTSGLAQNTDGHEFDPSDGNYTTEDTDADLDVVGPSLQIDRSYNSLDPRTYGAFGAGWSTIADMKAAETKDPTGAVTSVIVTYPGGEQVAFGRNSDGTFQPPLGRYARLLAVSGGGYTLTDKEFTEYAFKQTTAKAGTYAISAIKDYAGRGETFAYNTAKQLTKITNDTAKRSLSLTWTTPTGATAAHVDTVFTAPADPNDASSTQTWKYGYSGDQLTSVCPPADQSRCTVYRYTTGNHYRTTVLDADPYAYWRLGEASGTGVAKDSVDTNQGRYNGTYRNVTLGSSAFLAGSTQTTATFNGTTSYVEMPSAPGATPSYMTVSLWFRTTTAGGVLFYYGDKPLSDADPVASTTKNTPAVYVGTDGKLRGCLAMSPSCSPTAVSSATVTDGQWHNAVLTGQASSQTLYLDGVAQGSLTGAINDWEQPYISLGAGVNTQGWPAMNTNDQLGHYTGQMAEAAIYSEPLDPSVITAQYQAAKRSAGLLDKITTPNGKVQAQVEYGKTDDLVQRVTDGEGGVWKLNTPTVTGSSQVYRSAVMGSAPTGYWRLGDTLGAPEAANEVHTGFGTYNTVTQGAAGPFGAGDSTAATFNGTSSYAEIPFTPWHSSSARAVELWFKTASPGVLLSDQSQPPNLSTPAGTWSPLLYVGADGKLHGHWWSGGNAGAAFGSTGAVNDNAWHHAVLTADGTTQTLYVDGAKQADLTSGVNDQSNTRTFVGAGFVKSGWVSSPGDVSYFKGSIAEVAAYGHSLTEDQVEQHWSAYKASSGVAPVRTVTLTDPADKTLTYVYDAELGNRLLAAIDTNGKRTTYGYDTSGFLHTVTDANGNRGITGHDIRGNTVSQTDCQDTAAGRCATEYYTYYPDSTTAFPAMDPRNDLLLTERDARSSSATDTTYLTSYAYDTGGNLLSVTGPPVAGHPNGRTATTSYTTSGTVAAEGGTAVAPAGLVDTVTTPGGRRTKYVYYANGDLAETTDANGAKAKYTYDSLGRQLTRTEVSDAQPDGLLTSWTYDKNDQVLTETSPAVTNRVSGAEHRARTSTAFDADGNVVSQTVSDLSGGDTARITSMTYDPYNRLASRTDPGGGVTSYEYDAYGNKVKETDPGGNVSTYTYDAEGRPLTTNLLDYTGDPQNPQSPATLVQESRAYDPAGRLASLTDAMGWVTAYTYTDDGLTASVVRKDPATGKQFVEQANTYDLAGNLTRQITNDGRTTTTFEVDAADRVTSSVLDPAGAGRTTKVAYDPDDNVVTESEYDPATADTDTRDTRYDRLGNVTGTTVHDGTAAPVARWKLAETSGLAAGDSSGGNNKVTLGSSVTRSTEKGGAAVFNATANAYGKADGPAVNTSGSFTVSAWVKLGSTSANSTFVAQDGDVASGFQLYYATGAGWTFNRHSADVANPTITRASSGTSAVTTNTWTHLTGVYDQLAGALRLYVNGTQAGTAAFTTPWESTGPLQLGRRLYQGAYGENAQGQIADVQVYGEALTAAQVSAVYGNTLPASGSSVRTTSWKLDQRGLPTSMTDPAGNTTDYAYDTAAQQTVVTEPAVNAEHDGGAPELIRPISMTGYNTFGEVTETYDPSGRKVVTAYDADGQETSTTLPGYTPPGSTTPVTATSWNEYNKLGQVTAEVDPLGNRTTYTYTQLGDLASVTEPGGGKSAFAYTPNGDLLSATRPGGAREESTWDYLGRELTSTDIVRQPTQRAYTAINEYDAPGGDLSRTVSPTGVTQSYVYNALGEVTEATDGAGNTSKYTYTMDGEVLTATDPDGTSTRSTYDGYGQLTAVSDVDAGGLVLRTSRTAYDRSGNPVTATDPRGHTATLTYDATGLVTKSVEPVSATESVTTSYGYDAAGNLTRYTDGRGNPYLTTYNAWGLPESAIEPSTPSHPALADRTFTTVYDAAGRPSEQRSPGGVVVTQEYDAKSRLVKQTGTGAEAATADHTYTYDSDDRVTSVTGTDAGRNTFTYDDRGLLLSASGPSGDSSFAYDGDGGMTSRTDASGTSTYAYDTAGRVKTVGDAATGSSQSYTYDVNSRVRQVDYGSGKSKRDYAYDGLDRPTSDKLTSPTGKTVASVAYGWDENDNLTSKTTTGVAGASTNTYTYDWADRLASWNNGTTTEVYGYDASGNRTRVGGDTYTYDARSRLTSDGHTSYAYTPRGTLRSSTAEDGTQTSVAADAFNRVISEGDRTYAYDGLDRVLGAKDQNGAEVYAFQYSGVGNDVASDGTATYSRNTDGSLLGVKTPVSSALVWTDLHDDVVGQFTDAGESLSGSASYTPFGKVTSSTGLVGNLGYQSGWTDPETAKVNMAARWYSPEAGQFLSRDTVSNSPLPDSVNANRYAYANQNPMTGTDPTGHGFFSGLKKVGKKLASKAKAKAKSVAKSAWKRAPAVVKKAATKAKKTVAAVKKVAKAAGRQVYRSVKKKVRYVQDTYKRAKRYVKRTYRAVKRKAHKVVQNAKKTARVLSDIGKSVARKAVATGKKAAKKIGSGAAKAVKASANFVKKHAATIVSVAVGVAVFAGCTAASFGAGAVACGALAGAAASGVGYLMSDGPKSLGGFLGAAAIGGLTGALGGAAGGLATNAVGRLLAGVGGKVAQGAALGAAGGGAEGAVGYGTSCAASEEGCSGSGAAKAATLGALTGGLFGAAVSKYGPKGKQKAASEEPSGPSCRVKVPHSFTGLTGVLMANGTVKPISEVKAGDYVLTAEPGKKEKEKHRVKEVIVTKTDRDYVDVVVDTKSGPKTIQTTEHHQFYEVSENRWTQAGDLKAGQSLQGGDGAEVKIVEVVSYTAQRVTYDLSLEGLHTYYVLAGADPVLVHNINDPDPNLCSVPGQSVYGIPAGSSGGPGAGASIPQNMLKEYGVGKQWKPPLNQPLCSYCRTNLARAIDHVEPRVGGGDLTDANTTPACVFCNSSKRDRAAPLNPPPNYSGQWPPPWWPANMKATVSSPRAIP
ncbi:LamG-like jellyroll fold domain-containing protein [Streptomyces acidiscabies]|uniref:LamG-like jellyroll fold domain-containing protein n=1 Tax=Streptomyces acidiscabies TaxID=42234 RepID=UPI000AB66762|nr:LamG-like jellyroll fold domain-containing protein [Streptomyces acidiscabies]